MKQLNFVTGCWKHGRVDTDPSLVYKWTAQVCCDLAWALVQADRANRNIGASLVRDVMAAMGRLNTCAPVEEYCADRIWQYKRIGTLMCRVYE